MTEPPSHMLIPVPSTVRYAIEVMLEMRRFIECIKGWRQKLIDCNFQELVFEDAMDMLLDQVLACITIPAAAADPL